MDKEKTFLVKVSKQSDPAKVATSITIALGQGKTVVVTSVGDAIRNATKAVAMLDKFNNTGKKIIYEVGTSAETCEHGDKDISVIEHRIRLADEDSFRPVHIETRSYDVEEIDYNLETMKKIIDKKTKDGFEFVSSAPITESGNTTKMHLFFLKKHEVI